MHFCNNLPCSYGSLLCAYLSGSSSFASVAAAQINTELFLEPHSLVSNKDAGSACFRGFVWEAGRTFMRSAVSPLINELLLDEAMPPSVFEINPASLLPPASVAGGCMVVARLRVTFNCILQELLLRSKPLFAR